MAAWPQIVLAALLAALGAASTVEAGAPARLTVEHLRCEYLPNPLGIDEETPRLSWQLRGSGRGQAQTAYQLLVASSPERLRRNEGDLWDSGKTASAETVHVEYRGRKLGSGERAYWKVRAWDEAGRATPFSQPAYWEMGLLQPSDWRAEWIGKAPPADPFTMAGAVWSWFPEGNPAQNAPTETRYFRRALEIPAGQAPARAELLIAADDVFVFYVNGREAGRGGGWNAVSRLDLTPLLRPGSNTLALSVTNQQGPAGVLGRIWIEHPGGRRERIDVDAGWKASDREEAGWEKPGFADAAWKPVLVFAKLGEGPWGDRVQLPGKGGPSPYLRKEFSLEKPVRRARVYASALGLYRLFLNGRRVGEDLFTPGWTEYRKRVQYQTYDVTPLLRPGENAVGAILGDGWYAGALGWGLARENFGPAPARLRLQLQVEYTDGSTETVATDRTWRAAFGPIRSSGIYEGETYDSRLELPGWSTAGARSSSGEWVPVDTFTTPSPRMVAQAAPTIRVTQQLRTREITEPKPGVYVVDLGQNLVGIARLRVRGAPGTRVTLRFAEVLNPDGTVYRDNLRNASAIDVYVLKGGGEEVWEPHFTYHGFRYVELTGLPGRPSRDTVTGLVFHSAMPETSRFQSSSPLLNQLYRNVLWGQRGNLMSVPTDCPQRDERLGWMGDAQLFARTSCWYMDMGAFYTKWMRDIVDAQSPEGFYSDVSPRVIDMADGAPAWADAGLVVPWTVYQCYGDRRILERNWDSMRRYVDLLVKENPDLLWLKRRNNDFGDWVPAGESTNKDLIASAYLAYDLRLLSRIAGVIDRPADAERYGRLADQARDRFNARFLAADGRYAGDTQTAYAMALEMGLVPPERREQVAARLVEAIQRRKWHLGTGFIGTTFLLPALSETGRSDVAYRLLNNRTYPSWGYMAVNGATTIWELWNSDSEGPGMNSRNHFAFGTFAEWVQRYLAGIEVDPEAPGYGRFVIQPHPGGGLTHARAEYDSVRGTIVSEWKQQRDGLTLTVTVPANTRAEVRLPAPGSLSQVEIREGDTVLWQGGPTRSEAAGVTAVGQKEGRVSVAVGSGTYRFTVRPQTAPRQASAR